MPRFSRTDFSTLIPDPESALRALQATAPEFTRCPKGHRLPHRVDSGLCWADFCADDGSPRVDAPDDRTADGNKPLADEMDLLPRGLEPRAVARSFNGPEDAERHVGEREEALRIARAYGKEQARALIHQLPGIPAPPKGASGDDYYERRLEQIGPYVLEKMIMLAQFGSPEEQKHYVDELAERYKSKKREISPRGVLPFALVVQQDSSGGKIGVFVNPYDQQLSRVISGAPPTGVSTNVRPVEIRSEPAPDFVARRKLVRTEDRASDPQATDLPGGPGEDSASEVSDPLEGILPFWAPSGNSPGQ